METHLQISGRVFCPDDIQWLTKTLLDQKEISRESLARSFCRYADWYKPNGGLKTMSCKVALLRLDKLGLLNLPAPRKKNNYSRKPSRTPLAESQLEIRIEASGLELHFELVNPKTSSFWNELIERILSRAARLLPHDWKVRYQYQPLLLETFVEKERFSGTCYRAANWQCVGDTTGRGKWNRLHQNYKPVKSIWLYPLDGRYKKRLCE